MPLPNSRKVFAVKSFLKEYLSLRKDKIDESVVYGQIDEGVDFKGAQLWILIFAIFMASLGLNVNSTAVIIGAMLISPLMGPIIGIGFSVGINDFALLKRSLKSYGITTAFSMITATVYFIFTPFSEAQSELLARTSPTIYDVFIALFGGLAGFVAMSTKLRGSNVIPGVAIATALMPPLCTAGFGLASSNLFYFLGACYLYFINSVFIGLGTYIVTRQMSFAPKEFVDKEREKKVHRYIIWVVVVTMIPAVYLTWNILRETIYRNEASNFINEQLDFEGTDILSKEVDPKKRTIQVTLIGAEVPEKTIAAARAHLDNYKLNGTHLTIRQGFGGETMDVNDIRNMVMQDFYKSSQLQIDEQRKTIASLQKELAHYKNNENLSKELMPEVKVLYPNIRSLGIAYMLSAQSENTAIDTFTLALIDTRKAFSTAERTQLHNWLKARTGAKKLQLIVE